MLPDGVGAFGQILDTGIVGSLALLTGALPAQYGLRTAGVLDIQTKTGRLQQFRQRQRLWRQPRHHHAELRIWRHGRTDPVFPVGTLSAEQSRHRESDPVDQCDPRPHQPGEGISLSLDGDRSDQPPHLHERRVERDIPDSEQSRPDAELHGVRRLELQLVAGSTSTRTSSTSSMSSPTRHRTASSTPRSPTSTATASCTSIPTRSAISSSTACPPTSIARAWSTASSRTPPGASAMRTRCASAFSVSAERTLVNNGSTVLPLADPADPTAGTIDAPFSMFDSSAKTGWLIGTYVQDEWKITNHLTLNAGPALRPDVAICRRQPAQPARQPDLEAVRRHHVPRRLCAQLHAAAAGDRRADQSRAGDPAHRACQHADAGGARRTARCCRSARTCSTSAWCRRSDPVPGLEVGVDAYYKIARDLLDDGQFGAAYVLSGFNYDRGENVGVELKVDLHATAISAPTPTSPGPSRSPPTSSRTSILFGADELTYIAGPLRLHRPRPDADRHRPAPPISGKARASARR